MNDADPFSVNQQGAKPSETERRDPSAFIVRLGQESEGQKEEPPADRMR